MTEVNLLTKEIVWKYQESIPSNFFSPRISNAQRLPNGNTLINEGWFGRFFEVTSEGEVVWEYGEPTLRPGERGRESPEQQCLSCVPLRRGRGRKGPNVRFVMSAVAVCFCLVSLQPSTCVTEPRLP